MSFTHQHRVRLHECDPQGRVFNSRYLEIIDAAIVELWRESLGAYLRLAESGYGFVVAAISADFHGPARLDDVLAVAVAPQPLGRTSMAVRFEIRAGQGPVVTASVRYVCVRASDFTKAPWPEWLRTALVPYLEPGPA